MTFQLNQWDSILTLLCHPNRQKPKRKHSTLTFPYGDGRIDLIEAVTGRVSLPKDRVLFNLSDLRPKRLRGNLTIMILLKRTVENRLS